MRIFVLIIMSKTVSKIVSKNDPLEKWKMFCKLMSFHYTRLGVKVERRVVVRLIRQKRNDLKCTDPRCIRKYIGFYKLSSRETKHSPAFREWQEGILEQLKWIKTARKQGRGYLRNYLFEDPYELDQIFVNKSLEESIEEMEKIKKRTKKNIKNSTKNGTPNSIA